MDLAMVHQLIPSKDDVSILDIDENFRVWYGNVDGQGVPGIGSLWGNCRAPRMVRGTFIPPRTHVAETVFFCFAESFLISQSFDAKVL